MLDLLFVALWFILRGDLLYVFPCVILFLCFFIPFSNAINSLGEERANLSAVRTFVRFVLVWICRFPLPLGVWEGLRFVIVALPGLFSYLFLRCGNTGYVEFIKEVADGRRTHSRGNFCSESVSLFILLVEGTEEKTAVLGVTQMWF